VLNKGFSINRNTGSIEGKIPDIYTPGATGTMNFITPDFRIAIPAGEPGVANQKKYRRHDPVMNRTYGTFCIPTLKVSGLKPGVIISAVRYADFQ